MFERKTTCQAIKSYNLQPETRFGQEHVKNLGPEMMLMRRTKPKRKVKDSSVSQSGKTRSPPSKHDLVVKGTCRSPNYMKGTSSSEARIENKKIFNQKNQTGLKRDGVTRERSDSKPGSRTVRGLTKAPSFKRCSQRGTCSSTLKDSKFPEYLMLDHGGSDDSKVSGTSVLRVCPYTYCSLNGHLHTQYPPLKSFISSRRRSLKSQKSVKMEAPKRVEKECEVDTETQISETVSVGAPRSETDSNEYSDDTAEMVEFSESDDGTLVEDSVKEGQETSCEVDDSGEMVGVSEGDNGVELRESKLEEALVDDSVKEIQETSCEVDDDNSHSAEMVRLLEGDHDIKLKQSDLEEETLGDDTVKEIQEKANREEDVHQSCCFGLMKNSEADDSGEEILLTQDNIEKSQDQTEAVPMTIKVSLSRTQKPCNQEEESDATVSWTIIKCKKPVVETGDSREFNPREPNYLPIAVDADTEKVELKHQDMDERKNSEDWMFDCALQRAVTKLSSARKRKVALLVEAFETVKPVVQHGKEPAQVMCYGGHLQTCN